MAKKVHPKELCPYCEKAPCECDTQRKAAVHKPKKEAPDGKAS